MKKGRISKFYLCLIIMLIVSTIFSTTTIEAVRKPKISNSTASVYVGNTVNIKMYYAKSKVYWGCSNSKVLKFSKRSGQHYCVATFKGNKPGTAVVTAKVGKTKYRCKVTVKNKPANRYTATVYITSTGTKYHSSKGCRSLARSKTITAISLSKAKAKGYAPCSICN